MDRTQEARAAHFFQRGLYTEALQAYTNCISALPKSSKPEVRTNLLFNRSACYLKLKQFQKVVEDCNTILNIDSKHEKALGRKIKAMCSLGRFSDAQSLAHQWIQSDPSNQQAVKELERLNVIVKALKEQEDEDNIIMGSTGKNSPLHNKNKMSSPQSLRQGLAWNVTQARQGGISTPWQQQGNNSAWGGGSVGGDSWGQSLQMNIREQEMKESANNSVWGMAINTTWGDTVEDKNTTSDFPALSSGNLSNSNNSGKGGFMVGNTNETTSLVWSNNPLSSSMQHLSGLSASSQVPPYHIHQHHNANSLTDVLYNGKTAGKQTENLLFSLPPKTQRDSETVSQNPALKLQGSPVELGQDLSTLWPTLAPLNDRQKPLSPPWGQSANLQSKFHFAQKDIKSDEKNPLTVGVTTDRSSLQQTHQSSMLWSKQALQPEGSDTFPGLRTEDTFSALKSLISSAPKTTASMTFPSLSNNSTDRLLLQHMQRNTGPQQPEQENGGISGHQYIKSEIVDRLCKAGSMEEKTDQSEQSISMGRIGKPITYEDKTSAIGHSFIPSVIQTQMLIGKKTETATTTSNIVAFKVAESILGNNGHSLDASLPNGLEKSSVKGLVSPATQEVPNQQSVFLKDSTKLDGSGNYSVSSADESVISSSGSTCALDTTSESTTLKEDEKCKTIESDKIWKYRPPPRGLTSIEYTKCPRFQTFGMCSFGENCSQAHSDDELKEWKERFEERKKQLLITKETEKQGETYSDRLMEKLMRTENAASVMTDGIVEGLNIHVNSSLSITTQTKKSSHSWLCTVTSKMFLQKVVLIGDDSRKHYHISSITMGPKKPKKNQKVMKVNNHCQEWDNPEFQSGKFGTDKVFRIKVTFKTDIFGTFRQSVVFDFGVEPVVVRYLCVDSCPVTDLDQLNKDLILSQSGRWDVSKLNVTEFTPKIFMTDETEKTLLGRYPAPTASKIAEVSQSLLEPALTKENYKERLHNMLNIEEMAQFSSIAKFNVQTSLQIVKSFMLMPSTVSTAKYAVTGQLFARMELTSDLSEDTSHGRLILQNVYTVYLAPCKKTNKGEEEVPEKVYEALIEEKGKNFIFLKLSESCVQELNLKVDGTLYAQVQFQLNRMPLCEMHLAVDKLNNVDTVFPSSQFLQQQYPWGTHLTTEVCDDRLNEKQKEAVAAIIEVTDDLVPPVLLIGPYGTGKTFTLAQAAKQILKQEGTRVLICTHSNSAADLYIRDYLHPHVVDGHPEAFPLRIYYRHRWVQTVSHVVLQYCLTRVDEARGTVFVDPTREDVDKRRVLVATFSTCRQLYNLGLPTDFFSHILLDEAAQALECETLMPLALAGEKTRIVLAGDHMQLSPEIHSEFAKDRNFHISLLERLYDLYPHKFACKIMLCENYRSHKAIIDFTSELFYDSKLLASGNQPRDDKFYPLTFFTARGEDTQHQNSTAYYNNAEVYEIVERVSEVQRFWPKSWGTLDETSIGVVSPYTDQVVRIRAELRKKKLHHVSVERVLNVQGKQFRVIFLSTVRTRKTCSSDTAMEEFMDYGFLSNVKLLNTAITRAQSLVAVVGDPVSLCSIGKCRKLWERFLEICTANNSMYGMTWTHLRAQLDGVELKKTYILNPLAPEFVPNRLRHTQYAPPEPIAYGRYGFTFAPTSHFNQQALGIPPNMSWQQNPRLMQMMPPPILPPQMYLNHPALHYQYMAMLQSGVGGLGYGPVHPAQNMPPYMAMKAADPKVDPRKGPFMMPPQKPQQIPAHHNSGGVPKPADTGIEAQLVEELASNKKKEENNEEVRGTKAVSGIHQPAAMAANHITALHHQPHGRINPLYLQPQYQRIPGLPPHNVPPPAYHSHHPFLNAGGRGYSLSPFALGPPQLSGLLSPSKVGTPPHRGVPPLAPAMALKNVHSPSLSPRSNRSGSMSPNRMIAVSSSNVEFLPKAMNVRSTDDRKAPLAQIPSQGVPPQFLQSYSGPVPKVVPKTPVNTSIGVTQAQSLMKSPFLQRELYSYIMQTEGQGAAENFVSSFATHHPPVVPERSQSHQLHQPAEHVQFPSQHVNQGHPLHHSHSAPTFMPSDYHSNIPPPYIFRNQQKSNEAIRSAVPGQQFMAQDLERQWQEESLREHGHGHYEQAKDKETEGMTQHQYSKYSDRSVKPIYNPNFEYVAEQFLMPKRQSPFGDGPQPYSRQKLYGEVRRDSLERQPEEYGSNEHSLIGSRPGSRNSDRHTSSATSALSVDIDQSGTVVEKELGQIHIDSPVAASLSPPGATSGERKAPLYMRRVKDENLPPPRLSYAGALRSHSQTDSAENTPPTATPQTIGPYTPEDFPFFHNNAEKEQDPLELLRNLNIKESPGTQALFQYFS